jgi:hypothetical protein
VTSTPEANRIKAMHPHHGFRGLTESGRLGAVEYMTPQAGPAARPMGLLNAG